jgi:nicotinamide mononucleotide adenylyltransferase
MTGEMRLNWMREYFKSRANIKFLYMDERTIPPYPDGTEEWSRQFKALIGVKIDAKFFGEEAYFEMNEKYFPECAAVLIKRGIDTPEISATQIRENPAEFLQFVIPPAREFFTK